MVRTTVVGSWPIPTAFKPQLTAYYRGDVDDTAAHDVLQEAARCAMAEQRECGLDQIMGGEVFAPDFVHHVPPRLAGVECIRKRNHRAGYEGVGIYKIVGDVSAPKGTGHALAFRREKAIAKDLDKAAIPSALTLTIPFLSDPRRLEQMDHFAAIVEGEVADMAGAGATEIQLDAPAEAVALSAGTDPDIVLSHLTLPFRAALGVKRTLHFCLGDMGRKPFTQEQHLHTIVDILPRLEGKIDRVHLECSYVGQWAERELLRRVPDSMEVIAGIADVKAPTQTVNVLSARINALLDVIPESRLLVSSSCGCGRCTPDEARTLMSRLVDAARKTARGSTPRRQDSSLDAKELR